MRPPTRDGMYAALARVSGLALVIVTVLFQRRGQIGWMELVYLGLCVGIQESFLRLHRLRKWRGPMLAAYTSLPLLLVLAHLGQVRAHSGDFVKLILETPLPLVLVSVQIMVLYVRDAPRLVSVVLVLAMFSVVTGLRQEVAGLIWPWLAAICSLAAVYLALMHPGMLYLGVHARRASHYPPGARPGGILRRSFLMMLPLLALSSVAVSLALYIMAPRIEAGAKPGEVLVMDDLPGSSGPGTAMGMGGPGRTPSAPPSVAGLADSVSLGDYGEILKTDIPALEVRGLFEPARAPDVLYLRAFTHAQFDGEAWRPLPLDPGRARPVPSGDSRPLPGVQPSQGPGFRIRRYEVRMLAGGMTLGGAVPSPVEALAVREYGGPLFYDAEEGVLSAPLLQPGDTLQLEAQQLVAPDGQLARRLRESRLPATELAPEYTQLPDELRAELAIRFRWFQDLGLRASGLNSDDPPEQRGVFAAAHWIVQMFHGASIGDRPAWTYSLDTRPAPGWDAIARFLDTSSQGSERVGHCEFYASAMCALLRCHGIPCRLAAGYAVRETDDEGIWQVASSHAHAWVEVYFDGLGWVGFDPTPSNRAEPAPAETPDPVAEELPPTDDAAEEEEAAAAAGGDWFQSLDAQAQRELFGQAYGSVQEVASHAEDALMAATRWMPSFLPRWGWLRALLIIAPTLFLGWLLLRRRRKHRRIERKLMQGMGAGGRRKERGLYFQLLLLLAKYGYHKRPSETPREFARRVVNRGGQVHGAVETLTELYYALRFGADRQLAGEFRQGLSAYADSLKDAVQHLPARAENGDGTESTP